MKMKIKNIVFAALVVAGMLVPTQSALADEGTSNGAEVPVAEQPKPLEGRVEVGVTLENLRDARLSISRVRKATANLYDEMNRQTFQMMLQPNVVGSTMITTPKPFQTGQLMPPRKKWVDASMAEIGPIIKLFKEDVDIAIESNRRTDVRENAFEELTPIREQAFELVKSSFVDYKNLENATVGPVYDASSVTNLTRQLDSRMKELDKTLKKASRILTKESKAMRKRKAA